MAGMCALLTRAMRLGVGGILLAGFAAGARADETPAPTGAPAVSGTPAAPVTRWQAHPATDASLTQANPLSLRIAQASQNTLLSAAVAAPKVRQLDPVSVASRVVPIAIRLGAMVSPRTKFVGGADFSFPNAKIGPFYPRIDAEAIVSANFGGITTLVPVTFNGVYSKSLPAGTHLYGGAGIGPYFGEVTRFGGKIFVGGDFNRNFGLEGDVQFAGQGDALVTISARLGL